MPRNHQQTCGKTWAYVKNPPGCAAQFIVQDSVLMLHDHPTFQKKQEIYGNPLLIWHSETRKTSSHQTSTAFEPPTHLYHGTKPLNIIYSSMRIPTSQHVCFPGLSVPKLWESLGFTIPHTGPRKSLESLGIQFGVPNSQAFLSWHKWCQIWKKNELQLQSTICCHTIQQVYIYNSNFKTIDYEPSSEKNMKQLGVHVPEFKKEHYQNLPSATLNFDVITLSRKNDLRSCSM